MGRLLECLFKAIYAKVKPKKKDPFKGRKQKLSDHYDRIDLPYQPDGRGEHDITL